MRARCGRNSWIRRNPDLQNLLRDLAHDRVGLDHAAFDALPRSRTVEYLRGLLIGQGCLPPRDPLLARFERWLADKLDQIDNADHRKLIDRFARWHLLRKLRQRAVDGPVPTGAFLNAKQSVTVGLAFLTWLGQRGRELSTATQHDIDTWLASGPSTRKHADRLISWAREQRILGEVDTPPRATGNGQVMSQHERLEHLRRVLGDDQLLVAHRLVAVLVLLFGQPISKIVRLRRDDVTTDGDAVTLRLGDTAMPLPPPVDELMTTFLADPRWRRNTAANHHSPWLFPGTRPGQPLHVYSVHGLLKSIGIPARAARTGTWHELVRQAPPSILADALGIHPNTAMRYAARAGTDYLSYPGLDAPGTSTSPTPR